MKFPLKKCLKLEFLYMRLLELPFPKAYRIVRDSNKVGFGLGIKFDELRKCHVISEIKPNSCADFAGLTTGSQIIEVREEEL